MQNHLLEMDAKRAPAPGWETIRYMVSVVQYGGRITDEYDKLLMDTLAEKYFQQVSFSALHPPWRACVPAPAGSLAPVVPTNVRLQYCL